MTADDIAHREAVALLDRRDTNLDAYRALSAGPRARHISRAGPSQEQGLSL